METIYYAQAAAFLGAAIAVGIGCLGPAIGQGLIGMKACENIGKYPDSAGNIKTSMFLSMAIVETGLLYVTLIGGALCYVGYTLTPTTPPTQKTVQVNHIETSK